MDLTVAPNLYNLVETGHSQQQAHHLNDIIAQACDAAFARDLGPYSHDCGYFLHQAVHAAVQLRFDLLHPERHYEFHFDESDEIGTHDPVVVSE